MESHGQPSMIHVSQATRELLEGSYRFSDRGELLVKGKGMMRTAFLHGRK
jgi:guanylate cyclase